MAAVKAIAAVFQKVTRMVGFKLPAPPALAPIAPSKARNANDASAAVGTTRLLGATKTIGNGMTAPTAKVGAKVTAA